MTGQRTDRARSAPESGCVQAHATALPLDTTWYPSTPASRLQQWVTCLTAVARPCHIDRVPRRLVRRITAVIAGLAVLAWLVVMGHHQATVHHAVDGSGRLVHSASLDGEHHVQPDPDIHGTQDGDADHGVCGALTARPVVPSEPSSHPRVTRRQEIHTREGNRDRVARTQAVLRTAPKTSPPAVLAAVATFSGSSVTRASSTHIEPSRRRAPCEHPLARSARDPHACRGPAPARARREADVACGAVRRAAA